MGFDIAGHAKYDATVRWLQALPDQSSISWGDPHAGERLPFCRGWVDVLVPDLQAAAGLGWVWTVDEPDSVPTDDDPWWTIRVPTDLPLWELRARGGYLLVDVDPRQLTVANLPPAAVAALSLPGDARVGSLPWRPRRGWRPSSVSRALQRWTRQHTGRTDLSFHWDPSVEQPAMEEMFVARAETAMESYLVAESDDGAQVRAGAQVIDQLLAMDPDDAAQIGAALTALTHRKLEDDIMRDPQRIPAIVDEVTARWQQMPDMRLMQLLGNCFPAGNDPYYVDDDELLERLHIVYDEDACTALPQMRLPDVVAYAARVHAFDVDKAGQSYIGHVLRVWQKVWRAGGSTEAQMAALLHDVIEDHHVDRQHLLRLGVPQRVVEVVERLTRRPEIPDEEYYSVIATDADALVVKRADIEDNSDPDRMQRLQSDDRQRLIQKYDKARRLLRL